MAHAMIILNPITKQQLRPLLTRLPPRRHTPPRRLPMTKLRQQFISLIQHISLLLQRHIIWVLMAITVKPDFMVAVADEGAFFGKRFETMARDEPGRIDVVFLEEGEEATCSYCAGEETFSRLELVAWTVGFFFWLLGWGFVCTAAYVVA